jgi:PIN domain nuclease of toxin-antitoxin system
MAARTGLSLGDRACLAVAHSVGGSAITTEKRWVAAATNVSVVAIR